MEYTEKQIDEIILKAYFQGVFETMNTEDVIHLNHITIDYNWNGHIRVFMLINAESFNNTIINRIDSVLNMFEKPKEGYEFKVSFWAQKEYVLRVVFFTTRAYIQRIIDRSNNISFKEDE